MKTFNIKQIAVLDNKGETLDRYTIINKSTGDIIGSSENPFSPLGFGQYCGNLVDNYMYHSFGYSWRKHLNVNKTIKIEVQRYLNDCSGIGNQIRFKDLPLDVQKFTIDYFN
jgi:hypothetical protein